MRIPITQPGSMSQFQLSKKSGLWLPAGDPLANRKKTKAALAAAARAIRKVYAENAVVLSPQSDLGKVLALAERAENLSPDAIVTTREAFDSQIVLELQPALSVLAN